MTAARAFNAHLPQPGIAPGDIGSLYSATRVEILSRISRNRMVRCVNRRSESGRPDVSDLNPILVVLYRLTQLDAKVGQPSVVYPGYLVWSPNCCITVRRDKSKFHQSGFIFED
jgi:hypothetical protein